VDVVVMGWSPCERMGCMIQNYRMKFGMSNPELVG